MIKRLITVFLASTMILSLAACSSSSSLEASSSSITETAETSTLNFEDMVLESSMELKFAELFSVDYFKGGYKLISIEDNQKFLTIPENSDLPQNLPDDITPLIMPIDNSMLATTAAMSLISSIDATDKVSLSTYDVDSWYIDEVKAKLENGEMTFVGSYKDPDYELITSNNPQFAVYNTVILSNPAIIEKLKEIDIPLVIDFSSRETHPLARVEWVKLYGALYDMEDKANEVFNAQMETIQSIPETVEPSVDKQGIIFYINGSGEIVVRNGGDYIAKMYSLAGGDYLMSDIEPESSGTTKMTTEEFYTVGKQADYIIYIWAHGGEPANISEFVELDGLLADFDAVKNGNVWCTTPDFFQVTSTIGDVIYDMYSLLNGDEENLTYLFELKE